MLGKHNEPEVEMKSRNEKEYGDAAQSAGALLARSLEVLIEKAVGRVANELTGRLGSLSTQLSEIVSKQQEFLERVDTSLVPLSTQQAKIQTCMQQVMYSLERVEKQLERLSAESRLLENASRENHLLGKEHYEEHVVQPMARSLFPIFDLLEEARNGTARRSDNSEVKKLAEGVLVQLRQFLSAYEIEPIKHEPGARFDPREMKPAKAVSTHDKRLADRVAKSLQAGFRCGRERLLRPESVALYKCREPKSIKQIKERS